MPILYAPGKSVDVTTENDAEVIYLKGDATTDGSLRLVPDLSNSTEFELQLRSNGVWNDTGIVIAASTVYLGRELQISGGGEFILTKDSLSAIKSFIPHVRFDDSTGTVTTLAVPQVAAPVTTILQSDDSGEMSGSTIQFLGLSTTAVLADSLILRTGSTAATDVVTLKMHRDGYNGSQLFYQRDYAASEFPANTEITLSTDGFVELFANQVFYVEFSTSGTLSLDADVTNTTPYFGGASHVLTEYTVTPDDLGGALPKAVVSNGAVTTSSGEITWST